jgi:hypothetical protein
MPGGAQGQFSVPGLLIRSLSYWPHKTLESHMRDDQSAIMKHHH